MSLPERQSELVETHRTIQDAELPYVLVGGWAVSAFQTRFTTDIDAVVPDTSLGRYIAKNGQKWNLTAPVLSACLAGLFHRGIYAA